MKILHLDSSPFTEGSVSRELSATIVAELCARHHDAVVTYRDLGTTPPPHLSAAAMSMLHNSQEEVMTPALEAELDGIYQSIEELTACDVLVIGAPMYNHSIPSNLKAWLDQVCQKGLTFRYTPQGVVGLIPGKTVYIASTRGGVYSTPEGKLHDFQEPYLASILELMGVADCHVIRAEGVSRQAIGREKGLAEGRETLLQILNA
ncbi:MAG: NAD(P)H-dependent oxidoreductase [Rahnella inusitata]|jgi:FMN-dependent NADH-azoreductase|uniref:FMN-dependent NADH-azoreductase n=1 Tax=Rahnella inusitata TaxID=58169 RepID=UPI002F36247D